ncbi:hypothetical protein [Micromonospora maritima]|uniref:hypothetical protein n=1 Tax=Micromonospora maritima TaxID=986711 RepID=UPI00157C4372|nr:hypothetical protein [Micromonospora maritima]
MTRTTIRRWLMAAAFTTVGIAGLAAYDATTNTARADDKPAAVAERPGGVLDRGLPGKPVRKALDAVVDAAPVKVEAPKPKPEPEPAKDEPADKPTPPPAEPDPEPSSKPEPKPEPTREPDPEPEPSKPADPQPEPTTPVEDRDTDQAEPTPEPADTPAPEPTTPAEPTTPTTPLCDVPLVDGICQAVEDVVEVVDEVVPPVEVDLGTEPTPAPTEPAPALEVKTPVVDIVVTLPATNPATLPGADDDTAQPPTGQPYTTPAAPTPTPVALPIPIGPTIAEAVDQPTEATVGEMPGAALENLPPPDCTDPADQGAETHVDYRTVLERHRLTKRGLRGGVKSAPGCPKPGQHDNGSACTDATTTSNTGQQHGQPLGDVTSMLAQPTLDQLHHLRARSHLPASRHTAIEPGPA